MEVNCAVPSPSARVPCNYLSYPVAHPNLTTPSPVLKDISTTIYRFTRLQMQHFPEREPQSCLGQVFNSKLGSFT
jgi:hypothetical protein